MNRKQVSTLAAVLIGCAAIGLFSGLVHADTGYATKKHATTFSSGRTCVGYEVRSYGGDAGLRFMHNIGNHTLVKNGVARGKLCHAGPTTVEISRRHPHTKVVLVIGGERYVFRPHERSHQYVNHWHRKYVKLHFPGRGKSWKYGHKYRHGLKKGHQHGHGHWHRHAYHYEHTHGHAQGWGSRHHRRWW